MKGTINKNLVIISSIIGILLVAAGLVWYYWPWLKYEGLNMRPELDVADNIMHEPSTKIFADAIYNMEYTTFLHGEGPFTVFVPTDHAYGILPQTTKAALGNSQDMGVARQVALYHIVKGKFLTSELVDGLKLTTIQGDTLVFTRENDNWMINGASYIETRDIVSKNGVIHIVTNFLLPPSITETQ